MMEKNINQSEQMKSFSNTPSNVTGGDPFSPSNLQPLQLFKLSNLVTFFSFLSPLILMVAIVSLSFVFQNFKGFIYLGFLLACCFLREMIFMNLSHYEKFTNKGDICSAVQFTNVGNNTFSIFVSAFTFMYMCLPMFINNTYNWLVFAGFLFLIIMDVSVKSIKGCINLTKNFMQVLFEFLLGALICAFIVSMMYVGGSSNFLFFNNVPSNNTVCSVPQKQTFKCSVYKNGELIASN